MEFTTEAVSGKIIMVLVGISVLIVAGGFVFYGVSAGEGESIFSGALPFAAGVAVAMFLNIAKVLLMKRAVGNSVNRDAGMAKFYLQGQYFMRLMLTLVVFVAAGMLHSNVQNEAGGPAVVNFIGVAIGIFTLPVAMHSLHFFLKDKLKDQSGLLEAPADSKNSSVQGAIDELNAIGKESGSAEEPPDESKAG